MGQDLGAAAVEQQTGTVTKTDAAPAARTGRSTARVWWLAALAGIGAALTALGVGELLAAAISARSGPLVAVGGVVVDNVPEWGKQFAIDVFGTNDKLALQV